MWAAVDTAARARGWRAGVAVPMMHTGQPIGLIAVGRADPGLFCPQEVELLQTFADQTVIAILSAGDRQRLNGQVERILEKGGSSRDSLLAEVRDMVAALVARRRARPGLGAPKGT